MTTYSLANQDLVLDRSEDRYALRIRDLAPDMRPREKLLASGPGTLSATELLATLLVTGTTKEGVMEMSSRILKEYGEKALMGRTDAKALADDLCIPVTKAVQIVAAGELGRRFFKRNGMGAAIIRSAADAYAYASDMRMLTKEHLRGMYLNTHYQVIHDEIISVGTVDANLLHPREVYKPALEYSAAAVVLVHNHPSGIATPSAADREVTRQLAAAGALLGIELIDHLVVTESGYEQVPLH